MEVQDKVVYPEVLDKPGKGERPGPAATPAWGAGKTGTGMAGASRRATAAIGRKTAGIRGP
jgi:hypothetical protein